MKKKDFERKSRSERQLPFAYGLSSLALVFALCLIMLVPMSARSADRFVGKNSGGTSTVFDVTDNGNVSIGTASTIYPLFITSDIAGAVPAGVGIIQLWGNSNKERMEIRSAGTVSGATNALPIVQGKGFGGTIASPSATLLGHRLFGIGGSGHDGTQVVIGNQALIMFYAGEISSEVKGGVAVEVVTPAAGILGYGREPAGSGGVA